MKIGVFDSGAGGLVITQSIIELLPDYAYHYLGDTAHVPYGDRSVEEVTSFVVQGVKYLFDNDCAIVVLACNTASSEALRYIQQRLIPTSYPDRKCLGVIIPTVETAVSLAHVQHIALLATKGTVASETYETELRKLGYKQQVTAVAAPDRYLVQVIKSGADTLILGCTHYSLLKDMVRAKLTPHNIVTLSQDEIIPVKLREYLDKHPEIANRLTRNHTRLYCLTKNTAHVTALAKHVKGTVPSAEIITLD